MFVPTSLPEAAPRVPGDLVVLPAVCCDGGCTLTVVEVEITEDGRNSTGSSSGRRVERTAGRRLAISSNTNRLVYIWLHRRSLWQNIPRMQDRQYPDCTISDLLRRHGGIIILLSVSNLSTSICIILFPVAKRCTNVS
jgi:hypothetical protein